MNYLRLAGKVVSAVASKKLEKFGSLSYLAQWQGLRGETLDIDPAQEVLKTCSRTHMMVTFTPDKAKYINQTTEFED